MIRKFLIGLVSFVVIGGMFGAVSCGGQSSDYEPPASGETEGAAPEVESEPATTATQVTASVVIDAYGRVDPETVTISVGTVVTWTYDPSYGVRLYLEGEGGINSPDLDYLEGPPYESTYSLTFNHAGTFLYNVRYADPNGKGRVINSKGKVIVIP